MISPTKKEDSVLFDFKNTENIENCKEKLKALSWIYYKPRAQDADIIPNLPSVLIVHPVNLEVGKEFGASHKFKVRKGACYLGVYIGDNKSK